MPIYIEKPIGKTPLEIIKELKGDSKEKYSFAGRLDPMARGKLIILRGLECKKQHLYCNFDKVYTFEILFGFQTDTYDIMGLIESYNLKNLKDISFDINKYIGKFNQPYPPYSSIIVNKQPLWWWSREGRLNEITIPERNIEIYNLEYLEDIKINSSEQLLQIIKQKINKLDKKNHKDFRVPTILKKWNNILSNLNFTPIIKKYRATVSSGTYIRSLANNIGNDLGVGALAFDIHRTEFIEKK